MSCFFPLPLSIYKVQPHSPIALDHAINAGVSAVCIAIAETLACGPLCRPINRLIVVLTTRGPFSPVYGFRAGLFFGIIHGRCFAPSGEEEIGKLTKME